LALESNHDFSCCGFDRIQQAFEIAIAAAPGTVLFYAKAAVNDTLEVAFFD
jgi:hypothetical protein